MSLTSFSPRPRSLYASPSRSLSKNALSFFIRDLISQASSSSSHSQPSSSSSSWSLRPSSSYRAHSVREVAASVAFARNAPLSIVEVATWSSASVSTSFYLSDVQFSSDRVSV